MQEISGECIVAIDLDPTLPELIRHKTATPMPRQSKAIAPPPMQLNPMSCTNPPSPHSKFQKAQNGHSGESIRVKRTYFSAHKSMVKSTEKETKMMVESIDYINSMSLVLEEKQ
jgi:hypothetical protein